MEFSGVLGDVLEAVGTGLIAAALVSYLIRRFYTEEKGETVELAAEARVTMEDEYKRKRRETQKHEVVAVALTGALKQYRDEKSLLENIFRRGSKVRLLFLSPESPFIPQRAREDGVTNDDLRKRQRESVKLAIDVGNQLLGLYENAVSSSSLDSGEVGSFEIRLMTECPYCTLYMTDNEILWGLYTSNRRGFDSAVMRLTRGVGVVARQLEEHFEYMWEKNHDNMLVSFFANKRPEVSGEAAARLTGDIGT